MAFYGYIAWLVLEAAAFVKITGVPVLPLSQSNGNGDTTPEGTYTGTAAASTKKAGT